MIGTDIDSIRKFNNRRIDKLFELNRPIIAVFKEKHSDVQFVCLNRNELEHMCLTILWGRYHMGYYCDFGDTDDHTPNKPPISRSNIDAMPDGITKDGANEEWRSYEAKLSACRRDAELLNLVEIALRERDGVIAFYVFQICSSGEYEGFEIEPSEKIEDPPMVDLLSTKPE